MPLTKFAVGARWVLGMADSLLEILRRPKGGGNVDSSLSEVGIDGGGECRIIVSPARVRTDVKMGTRVAKRK